MDCAALTKSGARCKRPSAEGLDRCAWHLRAQREAEQSQGGDSFYQLAADDPEATGALAAAALMDGLDAEIAVLRVMVRWCVHHGRVDEARKCIGELARLLQAQHKLSDDQQQNVAGALDRVLDAVGAELGVGL
jgi:hypothetical protein